MKKIWQENFVKKYGRSTFKYILKKIITYQNVYLLHRLSGGTAILPIPIEILSHQTMQP